MVKLEVNGMYRSFDGDPKMPLLWYVRDTLQLTGTKFGCGIALCGAAWYTRMAKQSVRALH
jgi:isoquinoline 1-oxidoreductase alpha subunit